MSPSRGLDRVRERLASGWVLAVFGAIYLVSQVVIANLADRVGPDEILALQTSGFTASDYRATFARWDAAGTMPFYRAHFVFDDLHWLWYALSLGALLALGLDAARLSRRWNPVLVIPFAAGLLDCLENGLQHVFLLQPDYVTVIDPLPAISTVASIVKWLLALSSLVLIVAFFVRAAVQRRLPPPGGVATTNR